ncbi:MAG: Pyridoxamine 5-phosphate oxidase [Marmoricola sp.]|nr:Pyridoxamine 5-phosphate oxidase [Marmoricola sp.]
MTRSARDTDGLHELDEDECWRRLDGCTVGRLAYADRDGPTVLPLNYVVQDRRVWFRTASYDQLAIHLPGTRAAFEVDHVDQAAHQGWSVLVRGTADHVMVDTPGHPAGRPNPEPWPTGLRTMLFCLTPSQVSGRLITHADLAVPPPATPGAVQRRGPVASKG